MQAAQASSSNDMKGSTVHSSSSLSREYLQRNFPIFVSFENDFSAEKLVKCVLCILVGQDTPELNANKWSKVWLIVFCATCATFAKVRTFFCQCAIYAQHLRKILSPMRNICARLYFFPQCAIYAQDCTSFTNAQYMHKIVLLLSPMRKIRTILCYFFPQCAIHAQDCTSLPKCAIYAQDCSHY